MDWERKFYDIVQETESNLANARRKLQGHDTSKHPSPRLESSVLGSEPAEPTYQPSAWMSYVNNNDHINSIRRQMGWSAPSTSQGVDPVTGTSLHCSLLRNELRELQCKMDLQSQMIENLQQFVRTLNQEKNECRQQIRDLQNEVATLSRRVPEPGSLDPQLKSQVDLVRQEVRADLQQLQTTLGASRPLQADHHYSASLERSFKDMQKSVHIELEELRSDLNSMIHRIGKLELDVSTHSTSQRDLPSRQSQGRANTSSPGHSEYTSTFLGKHSSLLTPGDVFKVKELRNTVSQLHDKLDSLEGRVAMSKSSPPLPSTTLVDKAQERPSTSFRSIAKVTFKDFVDDVDDDSDLDDLGISDEFELDLPMDDKKLSDELDQIGDIGKTREGRGTVSPDIDAMFGDDILNDDLESAGLGSTTDVWSKASSSRSVRAQTKKKKQAMSEQKQDEMINDMLSDLDLDSTMDPYDLDSLEELSGDLKLDDLQE